MQILHGEGETEDIRPEDFFPGRLKSSITVHSEWTQTRNQISVTDSQYRGINISGLLRLSLEGTLIFCFKLIGNNVSMASNGQYGQSIRCNMGAQL